MKTEQLNDLNWLYGGNYHSEQIQMFNNVFSSFGGLATLEQEKILNILKGLFDEGFFKCLDEFESLNFIEGLYKQSIKGK